MNITYLCIDLKSFYASVECVTRGLDPLTTNLVVADVGRTEKTICHANCIHRSLQWRALPAGAPTVWRNCRMPERSFARHISE